MLFAEGETADQFTAGLWKQARHCNFGAVSEDNWRDQLIERTKELELKKRLLEIKNITLEQALEKLERGKQQTRKQKMCHSHKKTERRRKFSEDIM